MTQALRWLLAFGFIAALAASAGAQVSLPGTTWTGGATLKAKISSPGNGSDKVSGPTNYTLYFGPLDEPDLDANEFRLVLDDGEATLDLDGDYATDGMGRPQLTPDPEAFEEGLRELIDEICAAEIGDPAQCAIFDTLDLVITRQEFTVKPRTSKRGVDSIKSSAKIWFEFRQAGSLIVRVKLGFKSGGGGLSPE
jgi:hypothetical protein